MKICKKITFIFIFMASFLCLNYVKAANTDDYNYKQELAKFPSNYQEKIKKLHTKYKNAVFVSVVPTYKNIKLNWDVMLANEYTTTGKSLIHSSQNDGYKSTDSWSYNFYTNKFETFGGSWNAAKKETIAYYMDPRNFLDETHIFMFESLNYNESYHNIEGVKEILKGTFMYEKKCDGSNKTYAEVIMEAGKKNNISPYMLASRLRQEQGVSLTSPLITGKYPGYKNLYNYFNIKASGKTTTDVIVNGLKYASTKGWTTPYKSIMGGSEFLSNEYVNTKYEQDQNTLYLQKWDATGPNWGNHQYMQNIMAAASEATSIAKSYKNANLKYLFYIPVYMNMPVESKLPNKGSPNNYLKNITINGAEIGSTQNYKDGVEQYNININPTSTTVDVGYNKVVSSSKVEGAGIINLTSNKQTVSLKVIAENGNVKKYNVNIIRDANASLAVSEIIAASGIKSDGTNISGLEFGTSQQKLIEKIKKVSSSSVVKIEKNSNNKTNNLATGDIVTITSGKETKKYNVVIYGDVNGDGKILATDYVKIKNHIMGTSSLTGAYKLSADVNHDGKIFATDYVFVKNYIMGSYKISQ